MNVLLLCERRDASELNLGELAAIHADTATYLADGLSTSKDVEEGCFPLTKKKNGGNIKCTCTSNLSQPTNLRLRRP